MIQKYLILINWEFELNYYCLIIIPLLSLLESDNFCVYFKNLVQMFQHFQISKKYNNIYTNSDLYVVIHFSSVMHHHTFLSFVKKNYNGNI